MNPVTSFGIAFTEPLAKQWQSFAKNCTSFEAAYGLSETHTCDTYTPRHAPRWGTQGVPVPGVTIRIVDPDTGQDKPAGEVGEIVLASPGTFKGYWNKPEATAATLRNGWVHTGDMGKFDADGYLTFIGRFKEMIKVSGYSVFPEEVETILIKHPAVAQAAVIGEADAEKGEVVKAFIVKKPGAEVDAEALIAWSRENMANYKAPRLCELHRCAAGHGGGQGAAPLAQGAEMRRALDWLPLPAGERAGVRGRPRAERFALLNGPRPSPQPSPRGRGRNTVMFKKVLVANRGEIAVRLVSRAARPGHHRRCRVCEGRCTGAACAAGRHRRGLAGHRPVCLPRRRGADRHRARARLRCGAPRLWLPERARRLRAGLRRRRAGVHRPDARAARAVRRQGPRPRAGRAVRRARHAGQPQRRVAGRGAGLLRRAARPMAPASWSRPSAAAADAACARCCAPKTCPRRTHAACPRPRRRSASKACTSSG